MAKAALKDTWKFRRAFMFATVAFCMGTVTFVLWFGLTTSAADTAVSMAFVILGTTVASYVFGAAWEDINALGAIRESDDVGD